MSSFHVTIYKLTQILYLSNKFYINNNNNSDNNDNDDDDDDDDDNNNNNNNNNNNTARFPAVIVCRNKNLLYRSIYDTQKPYLNL